LAQARIKPRLYCHPSISLRSGLSHCAQLKMSTSPAPTALPSDIIAQQSEAEQGRATAPPVALSVKAVRYSVKGKGGSEKEILKGISVSVHGGQVLAIMGPSGAGKSTLMNLLTLEGGPGKASGEVKLNEDIMDMRLFKKCCALVQQEDHLFAFLTCREVLEFASDFHWKRTPAERKSHIDGLLNKVGLEGCQHTRVGNQFVPGLSGGQKRRLSLAAALVKEPKVVFLDEPTSGLDAAAAAGIMAFLKELARDMGIIVICTIHQPSARVFSGFDQLLLLSAGRVAFCGPAAKAETHFDGIGLSIPSQTNPADFLMDAVNVDFSNPESVGKVLSDWRRTGVSQLDKKASVGLPRVRGAKGHGRGPLSQISVLLRRQALLILRDPTAYTGRMIGNLFSCCFFALVYVHTRERIQEQAFNKMFLSLWFIGVPANLGVVATFSLNLEFATVKRDVKEGCYHLGSYILANAILQIPLMFVLSICAMTVGAYGIAAWQVANYMPMILVFAVTLWSFECVAQFFSVLFQNPLLGMLNFMQFWFAAFLFSGLMVPEEDVIWPLRALNKVSPLKYCARSMAYLEFHGTEWQGAELDASEPRGFTCPGFECFGRTGAQVLDSLGVNFKSISSENTLTEDVAVMVAVALFFKCLFAAAAFWNCRGGRPLAPLAP